MTTTGSVAIADAAAPTKFVADYSFSGEDGVTKVLQRVVLNDPNGNYLGSQGYNAKQSFTRPANTTPYSAGDVVGTAIDFAAMGPGGGEILITSAALEYDTAAAPSGMTGFRLYLYNATPPSALADNSPFTLTGSDRAPFLGYIDLGTPLSLAGTLFAQLDGINKTVRLAGTDLFGYLVTNGAFTPGSGDVFDVTLHSVSL